MAGRAVQQQVRLAELVAALSLGVDLGFSQPMEHVLRQCLIASRLAQAAGLDDEGRAAVYYCALLVNVGCHTDAYEQAKWFGDDIALKAAKYDERSGVGTAVAAIRQIGAGQPPVRRLRTGIEFALSGRREVDGMIAQHARLARSLAEELGLSQPVMDALAAAYERWDGHGWPGALSGTAIPVAARIATMSEHVEVAHRTHGEQAAVAMARRRSGSYFDPHLVDLLCSRADAVLGDLDDVSTWDCVIAAEPALAVRLSEDEFGAALTAIANFVDLKSPYTLGHSPAVARLAAAAGEQLALPDDDLRLLHRAGLVHDFGRLGVSNAIWDKEGSLGAGEWERVRMHPYFAERMLRQSDVLAPVGRLAVEHQERLDGSGYPRGLGGDQLSRVSRVLAAAHAYQAMREPRPHRAARTAQTAARELQREAAAGRLDADAVHAVLGAAGQPVPRRRKGPAGLTARELQVLQLLAYGLSTRQIADRLVISPKTAANHVEHIYTKTGARNRASASLYAVRQGLLPAEQ